MSVTEFSPAKINLFLAVTGRRPDGYHDLLSVAAPLDFGDQLEAEPRAGATRCSLECDDPQVPVDASNLVLRAAEAFAATGKLSCGVHFRLAKRIPAGAGLGGGSSNAVAALRALNALAGEALPRARLETLAAGLGSDCALFLHGGPVVMRGRGEQVVPLPAPAAQRLRGRRLLLFKPSFAIATPWAYRRLAERGGDCLPVAEAEARLAAWIGAQCPAEELLWNNLEPAAFEKFPALPLLLGRLRRECGVAAGMSGSGSACFALLPGDAAELVPRMRRTIAECWGPPAWTCEARIA